MKRQFKTLEYQQQAVAAVADCFTGQPRAAAARIFSGRGQNRKLDLTRDIFANAEIALTNQSLLQNLQEAQRQNRIVPLSENLNIDRIKYKEKPKDGTTKTAEIFPNFDIEMETGTGKTYCYIKTAFELYKRYGWSKFVIIVPTVAIREGAAYALQELAEHFMAQYAIRAKSFIYNSARLNELEDFASSGDLQFMIINMQAFNASGKDNRRIYAELDDFQSRRPIDVLSACRPIVILDEPQKQEGEKTRAALPRFKPLFVLRYSATHKARRDCVYQLDAVAAYNKKLVKKIAMRGFKINNVEGAGAYVYLEGIDISKSAPQARIGYERKRADGSISRRVRRLAAGADLFQLSGELEQYKHGYALADINAARGFAEFVNGEKLAIGEARGDIGEAVLRRLQIRAAIRAHLERERELFAQNIKVLSLFFIDKVVNYRDYERADTKGEYARIFEEEYEAVKAEFLSGTLLEEDYRQFLERDNTGKIHSGYFSVDKKTGRMIDSAAKRNEDGASDDKAAYDLILKDKQRLLSRAEPLRFIFSHSALREGWDNPNVFTLCMLKNSEGKDMSRRQEVGRGLRLCVNAKGERQDAPETAHEINVLTVIANESYHDFAEGLQKEYRESLSPRARQMTAEFFSGRMVENAQGDKTELSKTQAKLLEKWLIKYDYTDLDDNLTDTYRDAAREGCLAALPDDLKPLQAGIFALLDNAAQNKIEIDDKTKESAVKLSKINFEKKEFQELWQRINRKAVYRVEYDTEQLVKDAVAALDANLRVEGLSFTEHHGQVRAISAADGALKLAEETRSDGKITSSLEFSGAEYDLVGQAAARARLTRKTASSILAGINPAVFKQFAQNPEAFITQAAKLILEAKIKLVLERLKVSEAALEYQPIEERYDASIFAQSVNFYERRFVADTPRKHIYDKALLDSDVEMRFVKELEEAKEVAVYAKLPAGFKIPTPVGNYNPDWAIAFERDNVRHIYFIAETKGSSYLGDLRPEEAAKIECARRFFDDLSAQGKEVRYAVISNYGKLRDLLNFTGGAAGS